MSDPDFTRSCYATDADLYKAKAEYYEAKVEELKEFIEDQNRVIRVQVNHDDIMGSATQQLAEAQTKVEELNKLLDELWDMKSYGEIQSRIREFSKPALKQEVSDE